jgi:colicin import membrane protein
LEDYQEVMDAESAKKQKQLAEQLEKQRKEQKRKDAESANKQKQLAEQLEKQRKDQEVKNAESELKQKQLAEQLEKQRKDHAENLEKQGTDSLNQRIMEQMMISMNNRSILGNYGGGDYESDDGSDGCSDGGYGPMIQDRTRPDRRYKKNW